MANHILFGGRQVCRIGMGCWQLAGDYTINGRPNGYGAIDTKEAELAIHLALDNGINFFDTAAGYGSGRSETVLGAALKSYTGGSSAQPIVCTKYAADLSSADHSRDDFSSANLIRSVEDSLNRLQIDCLGAILLHNPPDDTDFSVMDMRPFEDLVTQGKILSWGVSCRTQKGVANVLKHGFGSVIEAVYNPLDRRYAAYFEDALYRDRFTFICRVSLASGFISARTLSADPVFGADDIRSNFSTEQVEWVSGAVRKLSFLNDLEGGITVSAFRFQLSNPYNTLTIPGMKNCRQMQDALLALRLGPLPQDVLDEIAHTVPEVFYKWR